MKALDPDVLATALNEWLAAHLGTLPRALALDGKYVRDLVLTLALSEHETGVPVAMTIASKEPKTEKAKTEGELTAAKRLYGNTDIQGTTITADALHCERESMHPARHASDQASQAAESSPIGERVRGLSCLAKNLFACKKDMRFLEAEGIDSQKV